MESAERHRKRKWFSLGTVIAVAAGLVMIYLTSILFDLRLELILGLYVSSTAATLWMALRILKDPYSTTKSFDDFFYEDRDDIRRCGKE